MSAETKEALSNAIAAHVADECGGVFTGAWVLVAETVSVEQDANKSSWFQVTEASVIQARGLLEFALDTRRWNPIGDDE